MKVPLSWLRDFVDIPVSPEDLGETLTLRGFELSAIEPLHTKKGQTPFLTQCSISKSWRIGPTCSV